MEQIREQTRQTDKQTDELQGRRQREEMEASVFSSACVFLCFSLIVRACVCHVRVSYMVFWWSAQTYPKGSSIAYIHTYVHTYIHTYMHACMHTYIYKHTCIYTYIHTYIYKHTCIYTYIHTCSLPANKKTMPLLGCVISSSCARNYAMPSFCLFYLVLMIGQITPFCCTPIVS